MTLAEESEWDKLPISTLALQTEIERARLTNIDLYNAFGRNITDFFLKELEGRIAETQNVIMSLYGDQGKGKSYLGSYLMHVLCQIANTTPNIDNVCFTATDLLLSMKHADINDVFILDEQPQFRGRGSLRESEALENIQEVVRKKQIHMMFISPDLEDRNHFFVLRPIWVFKKKKRTVSIFYKKFRYPEAGLKPMGYVVTKLAPESFLKKYERKKDLFINQMLDQSVTSRAKQWEMSGIELSKNPKFINAGNIRRRTLVAAEMFGSNYATEELQDVIEYARMELEKKAKSEVKPKIAPRPIPEKMPEKKPITNKIKEVLKKFKYDIF